MPPAPRAIIVALLAMLVVSCTTGRVTSIWMQPQGTQPPYKSLLVLGLTNNPKVRRAYEDNFVAALKGIGLEARPGHDYVSDADLGLLVRVTEAIARTDVDGVIVTHLIAEEEGSAPPPGRIRSVPDHYRQLVAYVSQVYDEVCNPAYYSGYQALRLETSLYDAKSEGLVWSGRSLRLDPSSEQTTIGQIIADAVAQLQSDGYLPRPAGSGGAEQLAQ